MAKIFCIDEGNTRTKWGIIEDGSTILSSDMRLSYPEMSELCDEHTVDALALCTVNPHLEIKYLQSMAQKFVHINSYCALPFLNAYSSPETLGPDRLALVAGMYKEYPDQACLGISMGTCLTYNFITETGIFRGGSISPGLYMRLKAMHEFTAKLPEIEFNRPNFLVGFDTSTAMQTGAYYGILEELDGFINRYKTDFGANINAILTGGDAEMFAPRLKNRIFVHQNLILKGVYAIAERNL